MILSSENKMNNLNGFMFIGALGGIVVEIMNSIYNDAAGIGLIIFLLYIIIFYLNESSLKRNGEKENE